MHDELGRIGIDGIDVVILWAPDAGLMRPVEAIETTEGNFVVVIAESFVERMQKAEDGHQVIASMATQAAFDHLYGLDRQ